MEKQLHGNIAVSADYVHASHRDLYMLQELNPGIRSTPARTSPVTRIFPTSVFNASVLELTNSGSFDYNGLQTSIQKRFSNHYQVRMSYTYSRGSGIDAGARRDRYDADLHDRSGDEADQPESRSARRDRRSGSTAHPVAQRRGRDSSHEGTEPERHLAVQQRHSVHDHRQHDRPERERQLHRRTRWPPGPTAARPPTSTRSPSRTPAASTARAAPTSRWRACAPRIASSCRATATSGSWRTWTCSTSPTAPTSTTRPAIGATPRRSSSCGRSRNGGPTRTAQFNVSTTSRQPCTELSTTVDAEDTEEKAFPDSASGPPCPPWWRVCSERSG